jgi:hypothetical protein
MRRASDAALHMFSEARRRSSQSLHNFRHGGVLFKDFAERRRRRTEAVLRSWSAGDLWALAKHDSDDEGDEKGAVQKNSLVAGMPLHCPHWQVISSQVNASTAVTVCAAGGAGLTCVS